MSLPEEYAPFGISRAIADLSEQVLTKVKPAFTKLDRIRETNQLRVIAALQEARLSESAMGGSTGYGYGDAGRDQVERAFAKVMGAEAALVRIQVGSGTQALAMCLFGLLRPGDELLIATGEPYDTLRQTIGSPALFDGKTPADQGSLHDFGVTCRQVALADDGSPDLAAIRKAVSARTRVVYIQKSRGYSQRCALLVQDVAEMVRAIRGCSREAVILVDNCYGEFVETTEPCMAGADLCAGSLIKNPGGGLCPSGGYIAGKAALVEKAAARLSAPGLGGHVGPTLGFTRLIAQGLFMAPHVVSESLRGAVFTAAFFQAAGYRVAPDPLAIRGDLVQTVELGDAKRLVAFCQAIQAASPVDSFVHPEPWDMPGYDCPVIMAAGTFVQGSSIELTADAPLRPPYVAHIQGGLCFDHVRLACMLALEKMEAVGS